MKNVRPGRLVEFAHMPVIKIQTHKKYLNPRYSVLWGEYLHLFLLLMVYYSKKVFVLIV